MANIYTYDLTKGLDWSQSKAVTKDGTTAMQGLRKDVIKRKKQISQKCVGIYCIFHREALITKKLKLNMAEVGGQENELNGVNSKQQSPKQQRFF